MSQLARQVQQALSANGCLSVKLPKFTPRDVQQQLGIAIADACTKRSMLVSEAGTGIGKTFAYLLPALMAGRKTLISTGSKMLQDQLFFKDLPTLLPLVETKPKVALLKGRSNYLCHYHLERRFDDPPDDPKLMDELLRIRQWSSETRTGDFAELTSVPDDSVTLYWAGSTNDNCLGNKCPDRERCCLKKARDKAMDSDLVVINHHLFFSDMALKEQGFGEVLPSCDFFVFDEAHLLPDIALTHFGTRIGSRQLYRFASQLAHIYEGPLRDCRQLNSATELLKAGLADFVELLRQRNDPDWLRSLRQTDVRGHFGKLAEALMAVIRVLEGQLGRDPEADHLFEYGNTLLGRLNYFSAPEQACVSVEYHQEHISLNASPLSVAEPCQAFFKNSNAGWVFTSATIAVSGSVEHFTQALGIDKYSSLLLDSPFDYANQALLCVPRYLPEPGQPQLVERLADIAKALVMAANGRTFLLFTSYQMMHQVGAHLSQSLEQPLLVQGMDSKRHLLDRFTKLGNAVLLGTSTFWEGVDVRGQSLSCVMIDKLPFASPDSPLIKARAMAVSQQGGDPFDCVQLPQATIALKQGVGRLIRGEQDRGVLVICDPRIVNRSYGGVFLSSLPPLRRTRDLGKAIELLRSL